MVGILIFRKKNSKLKKIWKMLTKRFIRAKCRVKSKKYLKNLGKKSLNIFVRNNCQIYFLKFVLLYSYLYGKLYQIISIE